MAPPPPLWLLLAWPLLGASQDPQAACGPQGCYAAYFQRRSFLEAWRGCRGLGGNLATLKHPEEAAQVMGLLHGARGGEGPPRRLFWIGLQRQPRQCFPQRPLRGFTWTTGDQDTFYTNWARPAGGGSCAAARCVVLDDHDFQWLEGSCTLPVDGYLCRFAFQGMCPGLAEEHGPVSYAMPFGPAGRNLRYVPFGTVATVSCDGAVPTASDLCTQKEDGTVAWAKGGPLCREDVYQRSWCEGDNGGCQQLCLDEGSDYSCECHAGYFLMPDGHSCAANNACRDQPCQFECVPDDEGGYQCQCPEGYELSSDEHQCEDVDECAQAPCEHQCENTEGSFACRCHLGFSPSEEEPGHCADTDECQIPGVCQQMCVNYVGGFECYCTEGYDLDADGISCIPLVHGPTLATASSHGASGSVQAFGVNHGWPQDMDHSLALSDYFPVFRDIGVRSPDAFLPSADAHLTPHPSASVPPQPSTVALGSSPPLWGHSSPSPQGLGNPTSHPPTADSPQPPAPTSAPRLAMTEALPSFPSTAPPTDLRSPPVPLAPPPALPPPRPPPARPDSPSREQDAVVGGVRALLPASATPSPAPGEEQARQRRDDRWLLVALLVPICVFVVVMLALGIVYCTRCGTQAKTRRVTQCYRWVISSGGKGGTAPASRPCQPATCRTSV